MTWVSALAAAEGALIYATIGTLVTTVVSAVIARAKLLPMWREHRANQNAILANQKLLLGDRFERPAA